jgi:hypothetical protein
MLLFQQTRRFHTRQKAVWDGRGFTEGRYMLCLRLLLYLNVSATIERI